MYDWVDRELINWWFIISSKELVYLTNCFVIAIQLPGLFWNGFSMPTYIHIYKLLSNSSRYRVYSHQRTTFSLCQRIRQSKRHRWKRLRQCLIVVIDRHSQVLNVTFFFFYFTDRIAFFLYRFNVRLRYIDKTFNKNKNIR